MPIDPADPADRPVGMGEGEVRIYLFETASGGLIGTALRHPRYSAPAAVRSVVSARRTTVQESTSEYLLMTPKLAWLSD